MIYFITSQTQIPSSREIQVVYSIQPVLDFMERSDLFGVDTETTGHWNAHNGILLLQIGNAEEQYVLDWQNLSPSDRQRVLRVLENPRKTKIFQNGKFDAKFLMQEGCFIRNTFDVMVAECLIEAGRMMPEGYYALNSISMRYTGIFLDKSVRGVIHKEGFTDRVIKYAAEDVMVLPEIARKQQEILIKLHMASLDHQDIQTVLGIENRAMLALAMIEFYGLKPHLDRWDEITAEIKQSILDIEEELNYIVARSPELSNIGSRQMNLFEESIDTRINWKSSQQKLKLLHQINSDIEDTSERVLSRHKTEHPIIPAMLKYVKQVKLYTGFAKPMKGFINKHTGRIHTSFWQNLKTGRVSTEKPNMQQIPSRSAMGKKMRNCFVPETGYKMVGGDYSGCELRIIAEFSQDPLWLEVYRRGGDLHSELCAMTFDIPLSDVKKPSHFKQDISYRDIQKTIDFGLAYGMSEYKLADTMQVSVETARHIIEVFFGKVPKVHSFLNRLGKFALKRGFIRTPPPYGRIRWFDDYKSHDKKKRGEVERAAKNHPIQGGNADITKLALGMLYEYIVANGLLGVVKLVHTVHDEIQCEVKEEYAVAWAIIMRCIMQSAGAVVVITIPMIADVKIGRSWGETH